VVAPVTGPGVVGGADPFEPEVDGAEVVPSLPPLDDPTADPLDVPLPAEAAGGLTAPGPRY